MDACIDLNRPCWTSKVKVRSKLLETGEEGSTLRTSCRELTHINPRMVARSSVPSSLFFIQTSPRLNIFLQARISNKNLSASCFKSFATIIKRATKYSCEQKNVTHVHLPSLAWN